jgi:glycosyltransferase involved in cell wall biosynthesis
MRLAWFSPWPPQSSGIAGRSAALVTRLAAVGHAIDVFVDARAVPAVPIDRAASPAPPEPGRTRVLSAHDFPWRHARGQYDLAIYQLGNSTQHAYIWPYLFRWPGLTVLHDARVHHARGHALLSRHRVDDYRAELAFDQPDTAAAAAELGVAGFDGPYYALWPMTRALVAASRLTAVHTRGGAAALATASPDARIEYVPLGDGRDEPFTDDERRAARAALGFSDEAIVFGAFGGLTADKRIPQILRAFAATRQRMPRARLLLAGAADPAVDIDGLAQTLGIRDALVTAGVLDDDAFDRAIAAVDVSLNLRWPTAVETSGPWVRAIAAARPTIVISLAHQAHVPSLDPRDWSRSHPARDPVTVAVDIVDEDHSLTLAMRRLAMDAALRASLGQAARAYWRAEHSETCMTEAFARVMAAAAEMPEPRAALPFHLRPDPSRHVANVLADIPSASCELF